ncbi:MAG: hypothetical protein JNK82_13300 [Myxococcaceae bacterium]|nr:hypothetical protein [Myxococcaceae bacterium]
MAAGTEAAWRALVEKELGGAPFDKALVLQALDGVSIQPLYTARPAAAFRELRPGAGVKLCTRDAEDLKEGADALWLDAGALASAPARAALVVDVGAADPVAAARAAAAHEPDGAMLAFDPLSTGASLDLLPQVAQAFGPGRPAVCISTLAHHNAGADAADELACALSTFAAYLRRLDDPAQVWFRVAVGRETFFELCKLRALRACHARLLNACGVTAPPRAFIHAVASARTLTQRDPWVNMLRVTTQAFAAMTGGADLFTPLAFDEALGDASALGRRVARNTLLVLRDESGLGRVADPAGGSYTFETLTDDLAREAWKRFQQLERDGGIEKALPSLRERFAKAARERADRVAKRKLPVLGVGEFANLDEVLPKPAKAGGDPNVRRDAEALEALRLEAEAAKRAPVLLLTLGSFAESRPRAGFAQGFFAAAGLRSREVTAPERAAVVCVCGSDERYATEAARAVRELKALGAKRVLLAGRPGALQGALEEAGLDGSIFLGCDVPATVRPLLEVLSS